MSFVNLLSWLISVNSHLYIGIVYIDAPAVLLVLKKITKVLDKYIWKDGKLLIFFSFVKTAFIFIYITFFYFYHNERTKMFFVLIYLFYAFGDIEPRQIYWKG